MGRAGVRERHVVDGRFTVAKMVADADEGVRGGAGELCCVLAEKTSSR